MSKKNHNKLLDALAALEASQPEFVHGDCELVGFKLVCTCLACPEQYDVFDSVTGAQVGYLRLRHGMFRADYPDHGGKTVYTATPEGDGLFADDERQKYLEEALAAIRKELDQVRALLTEEERDAIKTAIADDEASTHFKRADVLRRLLERTK